MLSAAFKRLDQVPEYNGSNMDYWEYSGELLRFVGSTGVTETLTEDATVHPGRCDGKISFIPCEPNAGQVLW